jgi:deoxyadenosine/deoxycytidine kinase
MMNHVVTPSLFTSMEIDGPIPILISIEGNIGAGKSTLLRALRAKSDLDWCFIDEPVDTWTSLKNDDDVSLLELFYGDQRRWSYTFQNCAVLSRFQNIEKTVANQRIKEPHKKYKVFVTERCLQTDYQVFAKMMRADGKMDRLEFDLYKRWYNLIEATATRLSAIVYVDTEPDVCFDRIRMRNRDGEEGIPLAYLTSLHKFQNEMIDNSGVPQCRVKSIDIEQAIQFVDGLIAKI